MHTFKLDELSTLGAQSSFCTNNLVNELKIKRNRIKMSQEDLASFCDTSASHISKIENFKVTPRLDTFLRMCIALNINIHLSTKNDTDNHQRPLP
ncbi:helix-turn-helix domain-containing protein [Vibrio sp. Sgm 5]|uniref:helix-turn-helix domain-containing protein n=1 Tax=Vibrio sp. Sgm 5 TaxID=2994387 RepID=UPI003A4C78FA